MGVMMRKPSVKTLSQCFDDPKRARRIFEMSQRELEQLPDVQTLISGCFHRPLNFVVRLHALNTAGGFHGAETLESAAGEYAEYLNAGDTYAPTVIYWGGRYRIQSVGDFVETMERRGVEFK